MKAVSRCAVYFALWCVMGGGQDLIPGLVAAALATWTSLILSAPHTDGFAMRPLPVARLLIRFMWGSLVAGVDVARRAFSAGAQFRAGKLVYRPALPPGPARNLFMSVASLMPGSVYTATDESDALIFHCLDVEGSILAELAADEARVIAALGVAAESLHRTSPA